MRMRNRCSRYKNKFKQNSLIAWLFNCGEGRRRKLWICCIRRMMLWCSIILRVRPFTAIARESMFWRLWPISILSNPYSARRKINRSRAKLKRGIQLNWEIGRWKDYRKENTKSGLVTSLSFMRITITNCGHCCEWYNCDNFSTPFLSI